MEPAGAAAVRLPLAPGAASGLDRRMPSFDITCEVDLTEVKNATNMVRKELHDALGVCNWMGPWVASPRRERGYAGDDSLESKFLSLATGRAIDREALDRAGERIFTLHRALTIRDMGQVDMRAAHDTVPPWVFEDPSGKAALTKGTIRMDPADIAKAMDYFYEVMGWDKATGAPGQARYAALGLADVGKALAAAKLTPEAAK